MKMFLFYTLLFILCLVLIKSWAKGDEKVR